MIKEIITNNAFSVNPNTFWIGSNLLTGDVMGDKASENERTGAS